MESSIKWLEGRKELFTLRARIVSSLYTRDENLATFMREKDKLKTGTQLYGLVTIGATNTIVSSLLLCIHPGIHSVCSDGDGPPRDVPKLSVSTRAPLRLAVLKEG